MAINIEVETNPDGTIRYEYYERVDGKWRGRNTFYQNQGKGIVPLEPV